MVGELADQHMRQEAGSGPPPLDRARRQWRLDEAVAARARKARPHDPVHDEPRPGTYSSSSVISSPSRRSVPPQPEQLSSPGASSTSMRGT
jgi:hypothetical protein